MSGNARNVSCRPDASPLGTPSGRIELFSEQIASFEYDDCPGHPTWLEPPEWLGAQKCVSAASHFKPADGQASLQLDHGSTSREQKVHGREQAFHPDDAAARGSLIMRLSECSITAVHALRPPALMID